MRIFQALALSLLSSTILSAQPSVKYFVKAGETPAEVLPNEALYVLPVFETGTVFLRDGSFSNLLLNYNFVLDEMQFIGLKSDTLAIATPNLIRKVVIDSLTFYYDKGYLQETFKKDSFNLAIKQMLIQLPDKTHGGYDVSSASSSITTYGTIITNSAMNKLQVKKDVYFEKKYEYFLGDQYHHFVKADKKGFLAIFSLKKESLQKYLKENNINFNKKENIEQLLNYCLTGN